MRQRLVVGKSVLVMLVALAPWTAWGEPWGETFGPAGPLVTGKDDAIIVVTAGARSDASTRAGAALLEVVRAQAKLAMDASSLGSVEGLDDGSIVSRCEHLPVQRIAILRVFPGEGDGTAVVTVYDKAASVITSFSGVAGKAVSASPGQGVSAGAVAAVDALSTEGVTSRADAQDKYEQSYIWFENWAAVQAGGGVVARWSIPYQGKYKKVLDGAEFYEVVGRADLASSYRTRKAWKTATTVTGIVAFFGGLTYGLVGILGADDDCMDLERECETDWTPMYVGGGITLAGTVLWSVGNLLDPHPVSQSEAAELADEHNRGLRKQLGLERERQSRVKLQPGVAALPGGGGLTLSGTF